MAHTHTILLNWTPLGVFYLKTTAFVGHTDKYPGIHSRTMLNLKPEGRIIILIINVEEELKIKRERERLTNKPVSTLGNNVNRLPSQMPFSRSVPSRKCLKQQECDDHYYYYHYFSLLCELLRGHDQPKR